MEKSMKWTISVKPSMHKKIIQYAKSQGISASGAVTVLINRALQYEQAFDAMNEMPTMMKNIRNLQTAEADKKK